MYRYNYLYIYYMQFTEKNQYIFMKKGESNMTHEQVKNEINYRKSVLILNKLLEKGFITQEQYREIDLLNRKSFPPYLEKLYD